MKTKILFIFIVFKIPIPNKCCPLIMERYWNPVSGRCWNPVSERCWDPMSERHCSNTGTPLGCCRFYSTCFWLYSKAPFIISAVDTIKSKISLFGGNHSLYKLKQYFVDSKVFLSLFVFLEINLNLFSLTLYTSVSLNHQSFYL